MISIYNELYNIYSIIKKIKMNFSSEIDHQEHKNGELTRRGLFLASSSLGLLIGFGFSSSSKSIAKEDIVDLNHYVQVFRDGKISIIVPGAEIGQGIFSTLPMIIAEEMDADWDNIHIRQAIANPMYGNPNKEGRQTIGNSDSIIGYYEVLRKIGAAARYLLLEAATKVMKNTHKDLIVEKSRIFDKNTGESRSFGELVDIAVSLNLPKEIPLKEKSDFRLLGKNHIRKDTPSKVDGSAIFGADVKLDGKLFAALRVSNVYGSKIKSDNRSIVMKMPGVVAVTDVFNGLVVIAKTFWQAKKASDAVEVEWEFFGNEKLNSREISKDLHKSLDGVARPFFGKTGDAQGVIEKSDKRFEAVYEVPYLAHACMEPMASTALVTETECKMWSPHQQQTDLRKAVADLTGFKLENVHLQNTFAGGGFGRKWELDFAIQSVQAAMAVRGNPVSLIWTREQDIQNDYYRSAYVARIKGAFSDDGDLVALHGRLAGQSILGFQNRPKKFPDPTSISGLITRAYKIPNKLTDYVEYKCNVPVGFWRGVSLTQNGFFCESAIDEIASYSNKDPYTFRRSMLDSDTREIKVLDTVARMSGWGRKLSKGVGLGIAICPGYGSVNAQVVEVQIVSNQLRVNKIWCAYDCGFALDPSNVIHQMEGGIVYGLSAAIYGKVTFENGSAVESNFHDYDSIKLSNMPEIEVELIESENILGGVGEAAVPPVAPALANAIFSSTGKRIRTLPIIDSGIKG